MIEQAKFTYYPLAFEKKKKTIEDQEIKQVESLKALIKSKENKEDIKPIEGTFPKIWELMKLKMK